MSHDNSKRTFINTVLLALVCDRVKAECATMIESGMDINEVNASLPHVLQYYSAWQSETLARCLRELEDQERPPATTDNVTPLRPPN